MNKQKLATLCLMCGTFFLPAGYDYLFKLLMTLTNSYWCADIIFYCISATFFAGYFYLSKTNPFKYFYQKIKILFNRRILKD